ncbi:MAG: sulfotransferase domain-containing protein [Caldilineaceae bacterium]
MVLNDMPMHLRPNVRRIIDRAGERAVLLAGSGRSGITWVQNIINHRQDHRLIHEPFRQDKVSFLPPLPPYPLYLRPEEPAPLFKPRALRILRGQFHSDWTDQSVAPGIYHRRLLKSIRANLMLKWLVTQMPVLKVVFLMRHPCAVSYSQTRLGWVQSVERLYTMRLQPKLLTDFLAPFVPLCEAVREPFEVNVLLWAIENYIPLKQFALFPAAVGQPVDMAPHPPQILLLFYEALCTNPEVELCRLFDFLGLPLDGAAFDALRTPAQTAFRWSAIHSGESIVDAWRSRVAPHQAKRAIELLHHFDLDQIYSQDSMPRFSLGQ